MTTGFELTRRGALGLGAGALALSVLPRPVLASAADDAVAAFTGGAKTGSGNIKLTAPEIAENGNTVPIAVEAPGATEIIVMAPENPTPVVCRISFGADAGAQRAATRIRLAKTQEVAAIAKMPDGSFIRTAQTVKVTIGGCGG